LRSLEEEADGSFEVVLVRNGETGPEIDEAEKLPFVRTVAPVAIVGFSEGCNLGAGSASGAVYLFLNPDTVVARGAMSELEGTLADPTIGIVMARLRLLHEPDRLNSSGNIVHISGLAWAGGYGQPVESVVELRDVPFPTGAAMALRADLFNELGRFTEKLFLYQEDLELGWRARMRGLRVVVNPKADVYHEYEFKRRPQKLYLLERNRLVFVLSSFSARLLVVVAPVLVAAEVALVLVAWREGWLRQKLAGWAWCVRNADWIRRHRRETQALRRTSDRELATMLTPVIDPGMLDVPALVVAMNPLMELYWSLARRLL